MKKFKTIQQKLTALCFSFLICTSAFASDDRSQINAAMACFFKWDLQGLTAEQAKACIHPDVLYHRMTDNEWETTKRELAFEGKGENAYKPDINNISINEHTAVVTVLFRYNPGPKESPYMKTIVLHKVSQGWRVTNVFWGKHTPNK